MVADAQQSVVVDVDARGLLAFHPAAKVKSSCLAGMIRPFDMARVVASVFLKISAKSTCDWLVSRHWR